MSAAFDAVNGAGGELVGQFEFVCLKAAETV
jgi:hypothetical protein